METKFVNYVDTKMGIYKIGENKKEQQQKSKWSTTQKMKFP